MEDTLKRLLDNAHSPYFHFPVASVFVMNDGKEYYGVNVETSSPAAGICAERNALYSAIADGYKKGDVKEIHVMTKSEDISFPCFICRQALSDFCMPETIVYSHSYSGKVESLTVGELCVHPFNEDNLS